MPVPPPIVILAGRHRARPVWRNELGGLTVEITGPAGRRFARWGPAGSGLDLVPDAAWLRWAAAITAVPSALILTAITGPPPILARPAT
jgi:kanamycin kinase